MRKPGGETYTNPLSGLPVKSMGRTCRPRMTASNSSSGIRTIRSLSNDAAAHPAAVEEGEATEHLAFGDVVPGAERLANAIRELLVVRHRS